MCKYKHFLSIPAILGAKNDDQAEKIGMKNGSSC